jgi:hypothetical protein
MASRSELFDRLKCLSPAQFEEVLFRLEIEPWIIPGSFAEQSIRAIRVIQRLEQEHNGLERLERTLAEPAISIIGEQYIGYEIEAQVKRIVSEYTQQPFEGREEEKRQLDEFVMNNSSAVLLVTAAAGFGKSALLSHWQQTRQEDCFIAYHCFSYRYEKTRLVSEAYRHLLKQLYLYYNIRNGQFPNDENRMRDILIGMLGEPVSQEGKRLVIVLDGLDEAEKTFERYVEQQLERLDELDLPEQRLQFFALLAVAKGVLEKEDIKTLTQMRDRDLRQLRQSWQVTRWMQITENKLYAFAHPLLATTFANKLGDDAEDALQNLIDYWAKWRNNPSHYALRYYAEHLGEAKRWEELYELAHNEEFVTAQRQQLPEQPDLPLKTVHRALSGTAETDDAAGMAEFMLLHAGRLIQITTQESPLEALRAGSITKAWALAEQFDSERCILWYLLLAWVLAKDATQDTEKMEQACKTLERLQQRDLPRLSTYWMDDCAVYLLTPLLTATKGTFKALSRLILDDNSLADLCLNLVEGSDFTTALNIAKQIEHSYYRAWALMEIATAQAQAENFTAAIDTAQQIDDSYYRALALVEIAKAQAQAENFTAAIGTAQQIDDSYYRALALVEIAKAKPTAENFTAAIDTAQDIDDSYHRALALIEIAKAQPTAENFTAAIDTAQDIEDSYYKAWALMEIAQAQAQAENFTAAIHTAQQIEHSDSKAWALMEIATAQAQAKNFTAAIHTAQQIEDSDYRARALMEIATAQAQAKNFTAAIDTAQDIDFSYYPAEALIEIAKAKPTAENFTAAIGTAHDIEHSYYKALALIEIAKAKPTAENFTAAIHTAQDIEHSYYKALALIEIAKAKPTAENFTAAIHTAQEIDFSYYRAEALIEIAKAKPTAENFTAAIDTAKQIEPSYQRLEALAEIAKAQVEAKCIEQALLTAEKILINRNEHLPDIAAAFVETGDKENFKRLLIPCAYYLDAAYKMCGHLAKLYPAQATAVAEVVSTINKVNE